MKKILFSIWFLSHAFTAFTQLKEVVIPGSQVRTITSSIVKGQEYELHILLPGSYKQGAKKYPVVYLMDSQWDFPLVKSLYGQQYYDGFIPELIIVGVTWGGVNPKPDSLRARDYTPTREERIPQSGGADNFLSFMKNELFPFIETNYRGENNNRTIMGCSLGGLITLYALFKEPDLFKNYVAASPAFGWDQEVIYQFEKKFTDQKPGSRLFMTMGGVERSLPGYQKLEQYLASRNYTNLKMKSMVLENTGHSGTKAEGFSRGLQYAFKRNEIALTPSVLKKHAGMYTFSNGYTGELKVENEKLVLYLGKGNRFELRAENENDFYSVAEFLNIHVTETGLQLNTYNNTQVATKIK
jgi:predicted alpha/beta superfamily hydrolase